MLERLKRRDPKAQEDLAERAYANVVRICRAHLPAGLAEHAAADVWTDFLFSEVDHVRSEAAIPAYLRLMTVRRCRRLRSWHDRQEPLDDAAEPAGPDAEDALVAKLDEHRTLQQLARCLDALTRRVREVLRLRFRHGLTQQAVGEAHGVSKQYAGRLEAAGLEALRRCLEKQG